MLQGLQLIHVYTCVLRQWCTHPLSIILQVALLKTQHLNGDIHITKMKKQLVDSGKLLMQSDLTRCNTEQRPLPGCESLCRCLSTLSLQQLLQYAPLFGITAVQNKTCTIGAFQPCPQFLQFLEPSPPRCSFSSEKVISVASHVRFTYARPILV